MKKSIISKILSFSLAAAMILSVPAFAGESTAEEASGDSAAEAAAELAEDLGLGGDPVTIGISVINTKDEIFTRIVNDIQAICDENGHTLLTNDANSDPSAQATAIQNFVTSGAQAIIVQAVDANAIHNELQKAKEAGVKVVDLFIELNEEDRDVWFHNDEYEIGYTIGSTAGEWVNETLGGEAKMGLIEYPQIPALITRVQGIEDGFAATAPNAEIAARGTGMGTDDGMNIAKDMMISVPELAGIMCFMDTPLNGAFEQAKIENKDPETFGLFGSDGNKVALSQIEQGTYYKATVALNSTEFGKIAASLAIKLAHGEEVEDTTTVPTVINADNVSEFVIE